MSAREPRRGDPERAIAAAIAAMLPGVALSISHFTSTPWWSATFAGARHEFSVAIDADLAIISAFLLAIGEHQFAINGHLVADIATRFDRNASPPIVHVEMLTIEAN